MFKIGLADVLFVFLTLVIMQHASQGMMDDPGLGWHLRLPDLMFEQGGFVYDEKFCLPTEGNRWVTRSWLCDMILRASYAWGGLNAVAILTCLVFAATLRGIYRRLVSDGYGWPVAAVATLVIATGLIPSFVARPNMVSFLGVWLVADLCQRFHAERVTRSQMGWLIPIMMLWANMHGGFLAGLIVLAVAWLVEAILSLAAWKADDRQAARARCQWLTVVGLLAGLATCLNPNGIGLHLWNLQSVIDPFIQRQTTTEWRPPDFTESGWFHIELLILLFPLLAATTRRRANLTGLAMTVVFLHFALVGRRYSTMWVVIAAPTLCELAYHNHWLRKCLRRTRSFAYVSDDLKRWLNKGQPALGSRSRGGLSWLAAALLLFCTPWMPIQSRHHQPSLPSASLDRFLQLHQGEPVFHCANWGGYLTWHGWDKPQRLRAWIDDRIEVHGKDHLLEYFRVMDAAPGWQTPLDRHNVQWICIPQDARLSHVLAADCPDWERCFTDDQVAVFRRRLHQVSLQTDD